MVSDKLLKKVLDLVDEERQDKVKRLKRLRDEKKWAITDETIREIVEAMVGLPKF